MIRQNREFILGISEAPMWTPSDRQPSDVVVASSRRASAVAVACEDVERAIRAHDNIAEALEHGVVATVGEPMLDTDDGIAALVHRQLDTDERARRPTSQRTDRPGRRPALLAARCLVHTKIGSTKCASPGAQTTRGQP